MTRGRKPKPTVVKKLSGNPGKRPLNANEPQFEIPGRMLNTPAYLDDYGAEVWRDLGGMLLRAGLLTVVDKYALGMFCVSAGRFVKGNLMLEQTGGPVLTSETTGNIYQNPWLHVVNKAWDQMQRMFSEFGLTPAERARLQAPQTPEEPSLAEQLFTLVGQADND